MQILVIIVLLVLIVIGLMIYNIVIHKRLQEFNNINQKVTGLNILQNFMDIIGDSSSVDDKIKSINDTLIENYDIKYSTIVIFDGTEYKVKASNVEEKHWEMLSNLHNEEIFEDSISSTMPKYITVNKENERLPYQKMEFGRANSAMFFPLYIDNVYIGYWIIESGEMHAFDTIDTTILETIKENIVSVYKNISYQNVVESIERTDYFTELKSAEYLYGGAKKIIDNYTTSTVCLFNIINIEEINEELGRETGNEVIIEVADYIKNNISKDYIFVRYMGPKFAIIFSGVDVDATAEFLVDIKQNIENLKIEEVSYEEEENEDIRYATPKLNFVLATYYKGTALEQVTKKLEEYLDNADENESDINNI